MREFIRQFEAYYPIHRNPSNATNPWPTSFTDEYKYKYYLWDDTTHTTAGTQQGPSYLVSANPTGGIYIEGRPPYLYPKRYEVIQDYTAANGRRMRAHHAGDQNEVGIGLVFYETHNPLKLDFDQSTDVTKISAPAVSPVIPGHVTLRIKPLDNSTPLEDKYSVPGIPDIDGLILRARLKGRQPSDPEIWLTLTPSFGSGNLEFSCRFDLTTPGFYDFRVFTYFNDPTKAGADWSQYYDPTGTLLAGTAEVTQAQDIPATMAFVQPVASEPTGHGVAQGVLHPQVEVTATSLTGVDVQMQLYQDNTLLGQVVTASQLVGSNIFQANITHLPAGEYTVEATLTNTGQVLTQSAQVEPPPLEIGDQLSFLPWVQPTLTYNAVSAGTGTRPQVSLSATLTTDGRAEPLTPVVAEIAGPGDVMGLTQGGILGTWPAPNAAGCSPLELVQLDFKDEDLPWRFSTQRRAGYTKTFSPTDSVVLPTAPLPWCCLLVLRDGANPEYEVRPQTSQPLASIRVYPTAVFPSPHPEQQELWAHVQLNTTLQQELDPDGNLLPPAEADVTAFLNTTLAGAPDLACSRLLSPRRLAPNSSYTAFLVPALQAGRKAGLGQAVAPADLLAAAMPTLPIAAGSGTMGNLDFPVYYQWSFTTGAAEDFESLLDQLHPAQSHTSSALAPALAVGTGAGYRLPMPGLLLNQAAASQDRVPLPVARSLYDQLKPGWQGTRTAAGRPVVAPPLYGRAYMVTPQLERPTASLPTGWKHEVNLDPRYRALAALGAEVVRQNQEEYVRRAWTQVQDLLLANEKLRGAQYGLRTTAGLRSQHLPLTAVTTTTTTTTTPTGPGSASTGARASQAGGNGLDGLLPGELPTAPSAPAFGMAEYGLHLTGPAISRVRLGTAADEPAPGALTAREAIRRSNVPLAVFSPTFRRILKPLGSYVVGQAGRPLRPTQPETVTDLDPALRGPRLRGTSLRQRDHLLGGLAAGTVVPVAAHAGAVRAYQFRDDKADRYLTQLTATAADEVSFAPPGWSATDAARFRAAFAGFRSPAAAGTGVVHFRRPPYQRPALDLPGLLADLVVGTDPVRHFTKKIAHVSPTIVLPADLPAGHFEGAHFNADDYYVGDFDEPADVASSTGQRGTAPASPAATTTQTTSTSVEVAAPAVDGTLPAIAQAKAFPVFRDAMGELLRQRHPELFVPGLGGFPAGGVAALTVNRRFIEAYMLGLNHALGSELSWRGFPVELRGTFFQQFWDVSDHRNSLPATANAATVEANLVDIKPIAEWLAHPLGSNSPADAPISETVTLRLALRSELLRRYPTLVLALQLTSRVQPPAGTEPNPTDPASLLLPRQRLTVGQDVSIVVFEVPRPSARATDQATLAAYSLLLLERPGQPRFGFDADAPDPDHPEANPLSWDDLSGPYLDSLGLEADHNLTFYLTSTATRPRATAEPRVVATLVDSARLAYALFQEPVLGSVALPDLLPATGVDFLSDNQQ